MTDLNAVFLLQSGKRRNGKVSPHYTRKKTGGNGFWQDHPLKRKNFWPQEFLILYHSSMSVKMDPLKRGKYFERGEWDLHVTAAEIFGGSRLR
ncbi:hypothetical protein [Planifilum fimeticola]